MKYYENKEWFDNKKFAILPKKLYKKVYKCSKKNCRKKLQFFLSKK